SDLEGDETNGYRLHGHESLRSYDSASGRVDMPGATAESRMLDTSSQQSGHRTPTTTSRRAIRPLESRAVTLSRWGPGSRPLRGTSNWKSCPSSPLKS